MKKTLGNGVYQRHLAEFGGLDCTGGEAGDGPVRFVRMDNLWRDYKAGDGDAIESFPGYRRLATLPGAIWGLWSWRPAGEQYLVVHAGDGLYLVEKEALDGTTLTKDPVEVTQAKGMLAKNASQGFAWGERFYILDGAGYYVLEREAEGFSFGEVRDLYIPTTYLEGKPYEQRNLLCDSAYARYSVGSAAAFSYGSSWLTYTILDPVALTCEVSGVDRKAAESVAYIPSTVRLGSETYSVVRIGWMALTQISKLEEVYISEGIEEICVAAFDACTNLKYVSMPDSLHTLRRTAFHFCPLERVIFGSGITSVERTNFDHCAEGVEFLYHGTSDNWSTVEITEESNPFLYGKEVTCVEFHPVQIARFFIYDPTEELISVSVGAREIFEGDEGVSYLPIREEERITGVLLRANDGTSLTGAEITLHYRLMPATYTAVAGKTDYAAANPGYDGNAYTALARCRLASTYDGRVFFAGNPALPATVFYCARDLTGQMNPAYVGTLNYFQVGTGDSPVTALLPTATYLAALRREPYGEGAVSYFCGQDTGEDYLPRIYIKTDSVQGRGCLGPALSFIDDPVYLSPEGVEALGRQGLGYEKSIYHRSTLIDAPLSAHRGEEALACEWEGYLVLLYPDGEAYLGDSRRVARTLRGTEYEWYHLTGVGGYTDDLPVYRYAEGFVTGEAPTLLYEGETVTAELHEEGGCLPLGATEENYADVRERILSGVATDGTPICYTRETDGAGKPHYYLVFATGERTGGTFSSPTALLCQDGRLLIGCENGCLMAVNTDRRGIMNDAARAEYSEAEYQRLWGRQIGEEWYSFAGHKMQAGFITVPDSCGIPNYTKKTLRLSTVVEMKSGWGDFSFQVSVNRGTYETETEELTFGGGGIDFTRLDLSRFIFGAGEANTAVLQERTKRWVSKQYRIYSNTYAAPFGIYAISYSYGVEGKVKNR